MFLTSALHNHFLPAKTSLLFIPLSTVILVLILHFLQLIIWLIPSSSSCHAVSTDFFDSLSLSLSIIHRFQQVFQTTSCVCTDLLLINSCWSANAGTSMCRGPLKNTFLSCSSDLHINASLNYIPLYSDKFA